MQWRARACVCTYVHIVVHMIILLYYTHIEMLRYYDIRYPRYLDICVCDGVALAAGGPCLVKTGRQYQCVLTFNIHPRRRMRRRRAVVFKNDGAFGAPQPSRAYVSRRLRRRSLAGAQCWGNSAPACTDWELSLAPVAGDSYRWSVVCQLAPDLWWQELVIVMPTSASIGGQGVGEKGHQL